MSKELNAVIMLPDNVKADISYFNNDKDYKKLSIAGPLGKLVLNTPAEIGIVAGDSDVTLVPENKDQKKVKSILNTYAALVNNMLVGVTKGFTVNLKIIGLGYRVFLKDNTLVFRLGYSHDVVFEIPSSVLVKVIQPNTISLFSIDKHLVHHVAAKIRNLKKPEPYKGKGIRYENENIVLKEVKKK